MPHHATLCSSICVIRVPASVFQHSCSSTCVFSIRVPASVSFVFQHLCSSIRVPASVFQHSCSSICVPAFVFQHLCFSTLRFQHLCSSICVSALYLICSSISCACSITNRLPSMTILDRFRHLLCCSICVCVSASVYQHLRLCVPASAIVFQLLL
jgi:hypothetical protein